MDVVSLCALRASGFEWQPRPGACALTVICKATFGLRPDECALDPEQEDPSDTDTYWNDDPARSLVIPSDRTPYKPRADVVLVGHAYAPKREPARAIMTRLLVGDIDKSIEVWSDRGVQTHAGQLFQGPRQVKMLLTWERAAGGPDTGNPVGMRFDAAPDRFGMIPVPNLQPPGIHFGELGDTFEPVGYGPIAPHWPARTQKLYAHAASFPAYGWERRPLPEPFNFGYFNVAPPDQQIAELRPNERIVLENLHPQHERIVTSLPGIRPRAVVDRATGEREEVPLKADTLWIDTDRGICTVVWRGIIGLRHPGEAGRVAFWAPELPMNSAAISAPAREPAAPIVQEETWDPNHLVPSRRMVTAEVKAHERPALPFMKGAPAPPPPAGLPAVARPPSLGPLAKARVDDEVTGTFTGIVNEQTKDLLPFAYGAGAPPNIAGELVAGPTPEPADETFGDTTMPIPPAALQAALQAAGMPTPFRAQSAVQPAPPAPPSMPAPAPPLAPASMPAPAPPPAPPLMPAPAPPPAPPLMPAPPPPPALIAMGAPLAFPVNAERNAPQKEPPAPAAPVIEAPKENIAPPPMVGPLAVPEAAPPPPEAKPPEVAHANGAPPAPPAPEEPAPPAEKKPDPAAFPIERCGALTARIALNKPSKARILEEEELSSDHWAAVENHWSAAIRDETKKGKKARLEQFDGAYVEQLEKERGPIETRDYARLMVAAEREATDSVLEEMRLPRGSLMRIERVWLKRLVKDPALMEKVAEAMESERNSGS